MAVSRTAFRLNQCSRHFARASPFRRPNGQRYQTTQATHPSPPPQSTLQRLWNSPVGVKTVHFWAPVMKWALVLAGVSDFYRPAEKLSLVQNLALTATGAIWTRWCFIIKPQNLLSVKSLPAFTKSDTDDYPRLAAVNFFLGCVGVIQVTRILRWQQQVKNGSISEVAQENVGKNTETVKGIAHNPEAAAKSALR